MKPKTLQLWQKQDQHEGDRWRLFAAIAKTLPNVRDVLYPGSYVDIAPSFVFPSVTYLDMDKRTPKFFADEAGVLEIVAQHDPPTANPLVAFVHADYRHALPLPDVHYDLLVSLYAGFISEHCTDHLKVGGTLLVNPSHGDAAMASIDPRYELSGVVKVRAGDYAGTTDNLDSYLVPKKPPKEPVTKEWLHQWGRAIAYTKPAFAYLFRRIA